MLTASLYAQILLHLLIPRPAQTCVATQNVETTTAAPTTTTTPANPCSVCQNIYRPGCVDPQPGKECLGYSDALIALFKSAIFPIPMCTMLFTCQFGSFLIVRETLTGTVSPQPAGGLVCNDNTGQWMLGPLAVTEITCQKP